MRDGYRLWDTHTHLGTARHSGRRATAAALLAGMDAYGVDRAVVIPFPVVDDYRAEHDEIGRAVRDHPDRFVGAVCLYPFAPEAAFREEIRRCVEVHGFRALKLQPKFQPLNPLSPRTDFFWETALEHDLTVIVHTGDGVPFSLPSLYIAPARRFPGLRIVLAHAGGGIYYQEAIVAAQVCPNVYVELSSLTPHHTAEVLAHVPASRLLIGSDLPESLEFELGKILRLDAPEAAKAEILWHTAARLFGG